MPLRYLGTDPRTDWIPGVPARDLTDADLAELGDELATELAASALYAGDESPPESSPAQEADSSPSESAPAASKKTRASKGDD